MNKAEGQRKGDQGKGRPIETETESEEEARRGDWLGQWHCGKEEGLQEIH